MSDIPQQQQELIDKAWRLLNVQADTMLKWAQVGTESRKARAAMTSALAALVTAAVAVGTALGWVLGRGLH